MSKTSGQLRRRRPRQRPRQCRGRARRPSHRTGRYRPVARRREEAHRPERAGGAPRAPGALHDRPRARRQAAARAPRRSPRRRHPRHRRGAVAGEEHRPVIRSAHLGVEAIVASPVAAALACLSEEERELGVALVELGAEVTNVSVLCRRDAGRPALDPDRRAATSPTTSPPPSASSAARPSG